MVQFSDPNDLANPALTAQKKLTGTFGGLGVAPPGMDANTITPQLPVMPQPPATMQPPQQPGGISSIMPPAPQGNQPSQDWLNQQHQWEQQHPEAHQQNGQISGGPSMQSFGPGSNLIGTQINPNAAPDTQAARTQVGSNLASLQGPDRFALAQDALKTFDQNQANGEKLGIRDIGRNAAAGGRLGSGTINTELGDLQSNLSQQRDQYTRGLINDASSQTLSDRLASLNGAESGLGTLSGLDTQQQNALRGERGYQAGLDQQATDNAFRQHGAEQGDQNQAFNQQQSITQLLANLGMGGPNPLLNSVGNNYQNQADSSYSNAGDVLRMLFANKGGTATATPYSYAPNGYLPNGEPA